MRLRSARARAFRTALLLAAAGATAPLLSNGVVDAAGHAGGSVHVVSDSAGSFHGVLATSAHRSLYVLSTEAGGHLHCTSSACLSAWPPLLAPSRASAIRGAGVLGKVGFVARPKGERQVTYNGYPVYTYVGDSGPHASAGQGVASFGGTWTLVHASAKTPSTTPYRASAGTTTKRSPTTTSAYGY